MSNIYQTLRISLAALEARWSFWFCVASTALPLRQPNSWMLQRILVGCSAANFGHVGSIILVASAAKFLDASVAQFMHIMHVTNLARACPFYYNMALYFTIIIIDYDQLSLKIACMLGFKCESVHLNVMQMFEINAFFNKGTKYTQGYIN